MKLIRSNVSFSFTAIVQSDAKAASPTKRVTEPSLYFASGAYAQWESVSDDYLNVRVQVTNKKNAKTVRSFELYAYATDAQGNRIYQDSVYYWKTTEFVSAGSTVYSEYCSLPNRSKISRLHFAVYRIEYVDGTVEEFDPDWDEFTVWNYRK